MRIDRRALGWMALSGGLGGAAGLVTGRLLTEAFGESLGLAESRVIRVAFEFGVTGGFLTAALEYCAARLMGHKGVGRAASSLLPGFAAGAGAGAIGQILYATKADALEPLVREIFRVLCWGLLAGLAGLGIGLRSRLLGVRRGLLGGLPAGLLGGAAFSVVSSLMTLDEHFTIALGGGLIGVVLGMFTILAETAGRRAWLRVIWAPGEERILPLSETPLTFGSDARRSQVLVRNIAPMARAYFLRNGRVCWTGGEGDSEHVMARGEKHALGNVVVEDATNDPGAAAASVTPTPTATATATATQAAAPRRQAQTTVKPTASGWRLTGPSSYVALAQGKRVMRSELQPGQKLKQDEVLAECIAHSQHADQLGLRNVSATAWTALRAGAPPLAVAPGKILPLREGMQLIIGPLQLRVDRIA